MRATYVGLFRELLFINVLRCILNDAFITGLMLLMEYSSIPMICLVLTKN